MIKGDISNKFPKMELWDANLLFTIKYPFLLSYLLKLKFYKLSRMCVQENKLGIMQYNMEADCKENMSLTTDDIVLAQYLDKCKNMQVVFKNRTSYEYFEVSFIYTSNKRWLLEDPYHVRYVEPFKEVILVPKMFTKVLLSSMEMLIKRGWVK